MVDIIPIAHPVLNYDTESSAPPIEFINDVNEPVVCYPVSSGSNINMDGIDELLDLVFKIIFEIIIFIFELILKGIYICYNNKIKIISLSISVYSIIYMSYGEDDVIPPS